MKFMRAAVFAVLALSVSACAQLEGVGKAALAVATGSSVADVAPVTLGDAEKVLTLAHNAVNYAGVQLIYNATPPPSGSGLLHGDAAAQAKVIFDKAVAALAIADHADAVANTQGILDAVGQAQGFIDQFKALGLAAPPGVTPPAAH